MNHDLQEKILDLWVSDKETIRIIKKTNLNPSQFKKIFAAKILKYLLDVYKKRTLLGDCPVVFAMLTIFKRNNLSITEIHHICDTFKFNLIIVLFEDNQMQLATKLLSILRENFKGVLKSFMDINYGINIGEITIINDENYLTGSTCSLDSAPTCAEEGTLIMDSHLTEGLEEEEAQEGLLIMDSHLTDNASCVEEGVLIMDSHLTEIPTEEASIESSFNSSENSDYIKNYVNTSETEEEFEIIHNVLTGDILDDFNDTNEMFFNLAVLETTYTPRYHELLSNAVDIYTSIFLDLLFFNKITSSLGDLKYLIADISIYSDEQLLIMKELTESLMFNLSKWKEEIIDKQNKAIHYYDDAILGDIEQLKVMISPQDNEATDDLDDIFDF